MLITTGLFIFVSLSANFSQGKNNLLGPYFGQWLSGFIISIGGPLPAFLIPVILAAIGWRRFRGQQSLISLRKIVFSTLLLLELCALLSINLVPRVPAPGMMLGGGGWIGKLIAEWIFIPLFGHRVFGPYFVTVFGIMLTVVWGANLRLEQLSGLISFIRNFYNDLHEEVGKRWNPGGEDKKTDKDLKQKVKPVRIVSNDNEIRKKEKDRQEKEQKSLEEKREEFIREKQDIAPQIKETTEEPEQEEEKNEENTSKAEQRRLALAEKTIKEKTEKEPEKEPAEEPVENETAKEEPEEDIPDNVSEPVTTSINVIAGVEKVEKEPDKEIHYEAYRHPSLELLKEPPSNMDVISKEELLENSRILEEKLNDFSVQGKVINVYPGPIITRYEVELAPGIKVSKVQNLENDLAMAMKALSIRILAPIPGKAAIGIELPNKKPQTIFLREILASDKISPKKDGLIIALGKTITGEPYVADLAKMPHLLVAGQTGSGKSVCINCIISSILYNRTPEECRMLMIDPKVVELALYNNVPHLLSPVVTDPRDAVKCLKWAVAEMERRYKMLAKVGVRNLKGFNQKLQSGNIKEGVLSPEEKEQLPYIVLIIDELADLMMTAANEVEGNIVRIAQLARAVGIHLIVATQRPSTNVITGIIKANMPSRVAFRVASKVDSRVILDGNGADKLLGRGDMLFIPPGVSEAVRLHGAFVSDDETESVVDAIKDQKVKADRLEDWGVAEDVDLDDDTPSGGSGAPTDADLFVEAARLVVRHDQGSTSLLQRRLKIGYARAGRLMDELEDAGIVGGNIGSKAREVLVGENVLEDILAERKQR